MTPQAPAEGIYISRKFNKSVFINVPCQCGHADDEVEMAIEVEDGQVVLHQYSLQKTPYWDDAIEPVNVSNSFIRRELNGLRALYNGLYRRISFTWNMWVHGYVEYHQYTYLNRQQIINYSAALMSAVEELDLQNSATDNQSTAEDR